MTNESTTTHIIINRLVAGIALVSIALLPACGKKEEPPPPAAQPVTQQPPAIDPNAPRALSVLQYAPEQTVFALGLPTVDGILEKATTLAKRLVDDESTVDASIAEHIQEFGAELGAPDATSLDEIAVANGLKSDAPIAVFVDPQSMMKRLTDLMAEAQELEGSLDDADEEEENAAELEALLKKSEEIGQSFEPDFLAVVGVNDTEEATVFIEKLRAENEKTKEATLEDVTVGSTTLKTYGNYGYFFANDNLFLGSVEMLKGAVQRLSDPLKINYGTTERPAKSKDDIISLVYLSRYMELSTYAMAVAASQDPAMKPMVDAQIAMMKKMFETEGLEEPVVGTLTWTDSAIDFETNVDSQAYPNLIPLTGRAKPLRLAQLVPKETAALIALRITEEQKKNTLDTYLPMASGQLDPDQQADMGMAMAMAPQALEMLGEEITLAVTPGQALFPDAYVMLTLNKPDEIKGMLQMFGLVSPKETYKEVEISALPLPIPLPVELTLTFADDVALLSTNLDRTKAIIDLIKDGKSGDYFATFDPPMPPNTPRYAAITVDTAKLKTILEPLAALGGEEGLENLENLQRLSTVIKELRIVAEMDGTDMKSQAIVYLHPAQ